MTEKSVKIFAYAVKYIIEILFLLLAIGAIILAFYLNFHTPASRYPQEIQEGDVVLSSQYQLYPVGSQIKCKINFVLDNPTDEPVKVKRLSLDQKINGEWQIVQDFWDTIEADAGGFGQIELKMPAGQGEFRLSGKIGDEFVCANFEMTRESEISADADFAERFGLPSESMTAEELARSGVVVIRNGKTELLPERLMLRNGEKMSDFFRCVGAGIPTVMRVAREKADGSFEICDYIYKTVEGNDVYLLKKYNFTDGEVSYNITTGAYIHLLVLEASDFGGEKYLICFDTLPDEVDSLGLSGESYEAAIRLSSLDGNALILPESAPVDEIFSLAERLKSEESAAKLWSPGADALVEYDLSENRAKLRVYADEIREFPLDPPSPGMLIRIAYFRERQLELVYESPDGSERRYMIYDMEGNLLKSGVSEGIVKWSDGSLRYYPE